MFKKLKKNNKASGWALIRIPCYMLLILAFMAAVDAVVLLGSMATLSYNCMYVTKQLAVNGGLPGGNQNKTIVVDPLKNAAHMCGLEDDDWSVYVESPGLSGGKAELYPTTSFAQDADRGAINDINTGLQISQGFNNMQSLNFTFIHKWKFCPIFRMLNLETPITISFNYRSEYIRPME